MPKLDEQISTLQERLKQLKLRQQRTDARRRALEAQRERKTDTRRKFVVGSVILEKVASGEIDRSQLAAWLDSTLTRQQDRTLFGLPPKPDGGAAT
jgi:large subunit ribosomal protein L7/L12